MSYWLQTVSYTHLDVYKRQVYRTSIQSMQNGKAPFAACMIELVMRIAATVGLSGKMCIRDRGRAHKRQWSWCLTCHAKKSKMMYIIFLHGNTVSTVSYTHLDVYKRQIFLPFSFRTEKALRQDVPWCKASNFFLYVSVSFFDVFSGAPYGCLLYTSHHISYRQFLYTYYSYRISMFYNKHNNTDNFLCQ